MVAVGADYAMDDLQNVSRSAVGVEKNFALCSSWWGGFDYADGSHSSIMTMLRFCLRSRLGCLVSAPVSCRCRHEWV